MIRFTVCSGLSVHANTYSKYGINTDNDAVRVIHEACTIKINSGH